MANSAWSHSMAVAILPFADQAAIYNKWSFSGNDQADRGNSSANAILVSGITIPWLLCPSSPLPALIAPTARQTNNWGSVMIGNYYGIAGAGNTSTWTGEGNGLNSTTTWNSAGSAYFSDRGLISSVNYKKMSECVDGLSNTLLVGEISEKVKDSAGIYQEVRPNGSASEGAWFKGNYGGFKGNLMFSTLVVMHTPNASVAGQTGVVKGGSWSSYNAPFASAHTGGAHVLIGDGTVRFISNNIYLDTLKYLAARDDGMVVGEF